MMVAGQHYNPVATRRGSDFAGKTQHFDFREAPLRLAAAGTSHVKTNTLTPVAARCDSLRLGLSRQKPTTGRPLRPVATRCDPLRLVVHPQKRRTAATVHDIHVFATPHRLATYNIIKGEVSGGTGLDAHWRVGRTNIALGARLPNGALGPVCLTGL